MDLPIEIPLKRPIKVGGDVISVLVFDEPTIGAQIDYAELEAELGLAELRNKIAAQADLEEQADPEEQIIPDATSMRVTQFWIEALAELPKGAARKLKQSDLPVIHDTVDAILGIKTEGDGSVGNETPAK